MYYRYSFRFKSEVSVNQMMSKKTILTGGGLAAAAFLFSGTLAMAADPNRGDIWVDSATTQTTGVTQAGPGHENDPHLPCADVGVFAAKMADPTSAEQNRFTIYAWPPSGSQNAIYTADWTYIQGAADPQEIAIVPASVFSPGGHFKIQVTQDPVKQKVFWVDCEGAIKGGGIPTPTPTDTAATTPTATPTPTPTPIPSETPSANPSPTPGATGNVSGSGSGGTGAVEGAVATASGAVLAATGAVLAATGTPVFYLVAGIVLVLLGAGIYMARRRPIA